MKTGFSIGIQAIIVLMLFAIGIAGLSLFVLSNFYIGIAGLPNFVPPVGAEYEQYFQFSIASVTMSIIFALLSVMLMILHSKTKINRLRIFGAIIVVLFIFTGFFSIWLLNSFNEVITNGAVKFDLNNSWSTFYQEYTFGFLILQSIMVGLGAITLALMPISDRIQIKSTLSRAVPLMFLTVGLSVIGLSIFYDSVISLLAGLGLAFWGSSLIFVSAGSYIKKEVAEATSLYYIDSFSNVIDKIEPITGTVYLPSSNSKCLGVNKVYNIENEMEGHLNFADAQKEHFESTVARLMKAPASDLLMLFERAAGRKFENSDYSFFERALPKLLVEELDIAQSARVERIGNIVNVKIENPIDHALYAEARLHSRLLNSIGTPLSSSIACALANCTRKHVLIKNHAISEDGKNLEIDYLLLDTSEV